jgi:hypothetical protein
MKRHPDGQPLRGLDDFKLEFSRGLRVTPITKDSAGRALAHPARPSIGYTPRLSAKAIHAAINATKYTRPAITMTRERRSSGAACRRAGAGM